MRNYLPAIGVFLAIGSASLQAQPPMQPAEVVTRIEALGGKVYRTPDNEVDIVALTGPRVTDADLKMLRLLPSVRILDLDGSQVTDAGLDELQLPRLEEVSLRRTRVSPAAAAAFDRRHPSVYRVTLSPGLRPERMAFAALLLLPLALGVWLIAAASRKRQHLTGHQYGRGLAAGLVLVVACVLLIAIALAQALGFDLRVANLFG